MGAAEPQRQEQSTGLVINRAHCINLYIFLFIFVERIRSTCLSRIPVLKWRRFFSAGDSESFALPLTIASLSHDRAPSHSKTQSLMPLSHFIVAVVSHREPRLEPHKCERVLRQSNGWLQHFSVLCKLCSYKRTWAAFTSYGTAYLWNYECCPAQYKLLRID